MSVGQSGIFPALPLGHTAWGARCVARDRSPRFFLRRTRFKTRTGTLPGVSHVLSNARACAKLSRETAPCDDSTWLQCSAVCGFSPRW
jgi:hypothetical protein